jgi:hypothetical protein
MVTIFGARFVTELDMNREYRGTLRPRKITEDAPRILWACICRQTTDERPLRLTELTRVRLICPPYSSLPGPA